MRECCNGSVATEVWHRCLGGLTGEECEFVFAEILAVNSGSRRRYSRKTKQAIAPAQTRLRSPTLSRRHPLLATNASQIDPLIIGHAAGGKTSSGKAYRAAFRPNARMLDTRSPRIDILPYLFQRRKHDCSSTLEAIAALDVMDHGLPRPSLRHCSVQCPGGPLKCKSVA